MDLLLSHGYFLSEDAHEQAVMKPYPPLGLLYLSAYLKRAGWQVRVHDSTFGQRSELLALLAGRPAPVLGLYTNLITRPAILEISAAARAAGMKVVLGGPEAANHLEAYLQRGADVVVLGEGELTLDELLPRLMGGQDLGEVAGIAYLDADGRLCQTPARPAIRDLDALPWPDREAIDLAPYLTAWRDHHGRSALNLITARGCPYTCRWCSHSVFGFGHARRSPSDVAAEVAHLAERYAPDLLWFADDVFSISPRWLRRFRAEMERRQLRLPFECITRADRVDEAVADDLAALGCFRVWIGSESGSQRILDAMDRGVSLEAVQRATSLLRARGIAVGMFFMWGYEGETGADIAATIAHVERCRPDTVLSTVAYPISGTPYHQEVAERSVDLREWAEGSDRLRAIRGRHSRRYYGHASAWLKAAHRRSMLREQAPGPARWAGCARAELAVWRARLGLRIHRAETEA